MKLRNAIVNYFVVPPMDGPITIKNAPVVFKSPITINHKLARQQLAKKYQERRSEMPPGELLHICFDVDSGIVYSPNIKEIRSENLEAMVQAAKLRIKKEYGDYRFRPIVEGSPFSSIRIRSISSFPYAYKFIEDHWKENSEDKKSKLFADLPVIEANLYIMPTTRNSLPEIHRDGKTHGGYIGTDAGKSIIFTSESKGKVFLLEQNTPFILINISADAKTTPSDKERVVLFGYRDYLNDTKAVEKEQYMNGAEIANASEIYAAKHLLYLGWNFEDVSDVILSRINIEHFGYLIEHITRLMGAANQLEKEGYANPSAMHYYITFKIGPDFPVIFFENQQHHFKYMDYDSHFQVKLLPSQHPYFKVIDYDPKTQYVIIETPAYLNQNICSNVLKAKSPSVVTKYNPTIKKIDVRSPAQSYDLLNAQNKGQLDKIKNFVTSDLAVGGKASKEDIEKLSYVVRRLDVDLDFERKMISDYYYVSDFCKQICATVGIPFRDIQVVVGPVENVLGAGKMGGFMSKYSFLEQNIPMPCKLAEGLEVMPPVIMVDNQRHPSVADQAATLVHEYRHYINSQMIKFKKEYGEMSGSGDIAGWVQYLSDPDERLTHKDEIKFNLVMGLSADEIIRDKVGGQLTTENYPIALKFRQLVEEAIKELMEEKKKRETPVEDSKGQEAPRGFTEFEGLFA